MVIVFHLFHTDGFPFPQSFWVIFDGGNIFHDKLNVTVPTSFLQEFPDLFSRLVMIEFGSGKNGWTGLTAYDIVISQFI